MSVKTGLARTTLTVASKNAPKIQIKHNIQCCLKNVWHDIKVNSHYLMAIRFWLPLEKGALQFESSAGPLKCWT